MKILIILFSLLTVNAHAKKITSSTLQGKVLAQNCNGPAQIWISQKSTLLYQAEAPLNATFEFHLLPGEYEIVGNTIDNCLAKQTFTIAKDEIKKITLELLKKAGL
ncbi:MAG: hypothetical protein A2504_08100 [Bdellovibrionales bacterium RIFOXYD12_FULL_39_22]|nr:MAG: hypothetical protein A2385_13725 [Bdellovibrionales bacterium RIFOXYB1_FULL_39_21]OFZ44893.1 MAG: hypothetical protein A2485_14935 [Bdellovibrionales bacterium RIFOXYC12_FULL_39_17]OFZ49411.1 MAG: hypothetical protein A2404_09270 [Bdellovibrionales bacterium RIFOXYC1_FULL_39_130]OFZ77132.1 MAG: hypothetical protein A2560_10920 [Bdellovibrionales bacterium RIFOXYD1_FULL_39_84]OFZ95593.1 MAG: hypothetical protein A2504_08100 [Bdellovibrionales bacterium RIFOXYD12_FULL_39_22]